MQEGRAATPGLYRVLLRLLFLIPCPALLVPGCLELLRSHPLLLTGGPKSCLRPPEHVSCFPVAADVSVPLHYMIADQMDYWCACTRGCDRRGGLKPYSRAFRAIFP